MYKTTVEALTMEITGPGSTRLTWKGNAGEASLKAMREFGAKVREEVGPNAFVKALVDAREATGLDRKARKEMTELGREKPWDRMAFVGVRFEVKVMVELVIRALQVLRIKTAEVAFLDTEEEAVEWLDRPRAEA